MGYEIQPQLGMNARILECGNCGAFQDSIKIMIHFKTFIK